MRIDKMNRLIKLSHAAIILLLLTQCYSIPLHAAQYKCTRVTDGDTITVTQNGFKTTIRLVGIDAPEKSRKKHEPIHLFPKHNKERGIAIVQRPQRVIIGVTNYAPFRLKKMY